MFYEIGFKPQDQYDAENALFFWKAKRLCLKAHIKRIDPDGPNFPGLVDDLADAQDEIDRMKGLINPKRVPWVQDMGK